MAALDLAANLRLYSPTERIWLESGHLVARIAGKRSYEKRKIQDFSFDALIGLTARANGAALITANRQDFEDLREYRRFRLVCWE